MQRFKASQSLGGIELQKGRRLASFIGIGGLVQHCAVRLPVDDMSGCWGWLVCIALLDFGVLLLCLRRIWRRDIC